MKKNTQRQPAAKTPATRTKLLTYAPEVEANRAAYERLAEAWIILAEIESNAKGTRATVDLLGSYQGDGPTLMQAFHQHLYDLVFDNFEWFDARIMRSFYSEMRLANDQLEWERKQGEEAEMLRRAK